MVTITLSMGNGEDFYSTESIGNTTEEATRSKKSKNELCSQEILQTNAGAEEKERLVCPLPEFSVEFL